MQIEQYNLNEFNMKRLQSIEHGNEVSKSQDKIKRVQATPNYQFAVSESNRPLARVPMKAVKMTNHITGSDQYVQPPDIVINPTNGYELDYFKSVSKE